MNKCQNCGEANQDDAKFCAKCGSILRAQTLRTGERLTPGVPKVVPMTRIGGAKPAAGEPKGEKPRVRLEVEQDEWNRLEKEAGQERAGRERAEEKLEKFRQESADWAYAFEQLQAKTAYLKRYGKIVLIAAPALFVVSLVICAVGLSAGGKKERELVELRQYKDMYDSVLTRSKRAAAERDSLRRELGDLSERYGELSAKKTYYGAGFQGGRANIEMASVRGGTFTMGCTAEQAGDCDDDEKPARGVTVGNFSIAKYPVTQAQWKHIMGGNPSHYRGDNLPVEQVSWRDVQEFIKRLNAATGKRYRLPTEAEWEYAARGGAESRGYKYAGSGHPEEVAWYGRGGGTHAVGAKRPNELGIYDMSGNVCEWVNDRYGAEGSGDRVLRGGSWSNMAKNCRVSDRVGYPSGARGNYIGFRLAHSQ